MIPISKTQRRPSAPKHTKNGGDSGWRIKAADPSETVESANVAKEGRRVGLEAEIE